MSSSTTKELIRATAVEVRFPGQPAVVEGLDLTIHRGDFVSIVGPSGCGKTTILRLVAGLQEASGGRLSVRGTPRAGYVFQDANLLPWRTAIGNIALPLELLGVKRVARDAAIASCLDLVDLAPADYRKFPRMLSGGMKMRVALARALVTEPELLLCDEPFAALDDILRQQLNEELMRLWHQQGWTALFVTHHVAEAVYLSQRILVMQSHPGRIAATIEVPFPFPRDPAIRRDPEFAELTFRISQQLRGV